MATPLEQCGSRRAMRFRNAVSLGNVLLAVGFCCFAPYAPSPRGMLVWHCSILHWRRFSQCTGRSILLGVQSRRNDQTSAFAGESRRCRHSHGKAASSTASETRAAVRPGLRPIEYPTTSAARIAVSRRSIRSSLKGPLRAPRKPRKPAISISLTLPRPAETDQTVQRAGQHQLRRAE